MLPWETLRACDDRRARRRNNLTDFEVLEGRQLLSYSSLGYSLPDLSITGQAGPVAAWGGSLTVKVILKNTGASTIGEPLSLTPTTQVFTGPDGRAVPPYYVPSSADAGTVPIAAFLTPSPHSMAGAISLGTFQCTVPITKRRQAILRALWAAPASEQPSGHRHLLCPALRQPGPDDHRVQLHQ